MKELFSFQKLNLTNDGVYKCTQCENIIQCFSTDENTNFCPSCGARSDIFNDVEEEKNG